MMEIRKQINNILKTKCTNVYHKKGKQPYPYVVFSISELSYDSGKHSCELEVNVIDKGSSSEVVEEISDSIQSTLNSYNYNSINLQFRTFIGSRKIVEEEDKEIERRRLLFELYYYTKGE